MSRIMDLRGQTFGRLVVLNAPPKRIGKQTVWRCRCVCGIEREVPAIMLRTGTTKSCGCLRREVTAALKRTHGHGGGGARRQPEYRIWLRLKQCCTNPKNPNWRLYGGRGITVCDRWKQSFMAFYTDMGPRPPNTSSKKRFYSLDRMDNDGPYAPENCRWATGSEQMNNTRVNHRLTLHGETLTLRQWERKMNLPKDILKQRFVLGWSVERALTTPKLFAWMRRSDYH